jgi:hypothetical protein
MTGRVRNARRRSCAATCLAVCGVLLTGASEAAQEPAHAPPGESATSSNLPFTFDGPLPPLPPEVIARDQSGRATIRAVRLTSPLRLDGQLDEEFYNTIPAISDFIQQEPREGAAATERTEAWLLFDADHVYVSFRCWESRPERMVVNEMRRDDMNVYQNDHIAFVFDTFYDRRNAVEFVINPLGGRMDGQITNERQYGGDWNPVWDLKVGRFEGGWTLETAIPFKSLRYRPGRAQIWGFNVRRVTRWNNEWSYLTRIPSALSGMGIFQVSLAATVVGLEAPAGSKHIEIKPYAISNIRSDLVATPKISNELGGDIGLDAKYGITQNLTTDFTYNTDFAQVEADEQQVNLTRFSLFFPEKREFFLENQGTFAFGGAGSNGGGGGTSGTNDTPILFYSRRIGLERGQVVPIQAGGRLTGRVGRYTLGALNIHADDEPLSGSPATNFSVVRIKRDVLRRSSIGTIFTRRSLSPTAPGSNTAYGVDGTFAFFDNLAINTYWARTQTEGLSGNDISYRAQLDYAGDRYGVQLERLLVGEDFNPEVGFLRRDDMRRSFAQFRFSPRPRGIRTVRKFSWLGSIAYVENLAGRLETRNRAGEFGIELQNSDKFTIHYEDAYEFLPRPFPIATGVTLPVGPYDFASTRAGYNFGRQRKWSGNVTVEYGSFYSGHKTAVGVSQGRLNFTSQFSVEPAYSVNKVDLAGGAFTTHLAGSRIIYTITPLMFVSALLQYSSGDNSVSNNVRFRWEYRPGSELFLVYNEQRDTVAVRFPALANRAFIVKVNRLLRF